MDGLTQAAQSALEALTELGQATAADVRVRIGKSRHVTDKALTELAEAGWIVEVTPGPDDADGTPTRWQPAPTGEQTDTTPPASDNDNGDSDNGDGDSHDGEKVAAAVARPADRKVLIIAGILGDYPEGTTIDVIAAACGMGELTVAKLLAAMEVADAARRVPADNEASTPEMWKPGEGKASQVDPNPPAPRCHACGQIIRPARTTTDQSTGRETSTVNNDGNEPLGRNELRGLVAAYINANPGVVLTPQRIADDLSRQHGRAISNGAVRNNCTTLAAAGQIQLASETPLAFTANSETPNP